MHYSAFMICVLLKRKRKIKFSLLRIKGSFSLVWLYLAYVRLIDVQQRISLKAIKLLKLLTGIAIFIRRFQFRNPRNF